MYLCRSARSRKRKFDVIFDEDAATESSTNSSSSGSSTESETETETESSTKPQPHSRPKSNGHKDEGSDGENDNGNGQETDGPPEDEKDEIPFRQLPTEGAVIENVRKKKGRGRPPGTGGGCSSSHSHASSGEEKYSSSAEIIESNSQTTDEEFMLVPIRNAAKTALIQNHGKDRAIELENERRLRKISLLQQAVKPPVPKGHSRRTKINKRELEVEKGSCSWKDLSFHKNLIHRGHVYKEGNIYSIEANDETDPKGYQKYFCQIKGLLYLNDHLKDITDCAIVVYNWILPIRPFNADLDKFNLMDFDIDDDSDPSYLSTNYLTFVCECPPDFFRIKRLHFMGEVEQ